LVFLTSNQERRLGDPSVLSKGLGLIKSLVAEGLKGAANKLGETALADWQSWLNQLTQLVHHLR